MKKIIKLTIKFLVLGGILLGGFLYYISSTENINISKKETYIFLRKKTSFHKVKEVLSDKLINPNTFEWWAKIKGYDKKVKSGRYKIKKGWSNKELVRHLKLGKRTPVKFIFNNQQTVEDFAGRASQQLEADSISILKAIYDEQFLKKYGFNKATIKSIFIPNTYNIYWGTTPEKFVKRMYKEYNFFWNKSRLTKAKKAGLTPLEVIILASIVHKETSKKREKRRVAGLYINRLNKRMRLESCPTVIYILKTEYGIEKKISRVLNKDLKIKSTYNTYINYGLPPAPICIPDIDVIDAVLNYEKHNYLYLCADPDRFGYNSFAKNLRTHNKNRRKYINWLRKKKIRR